MSHLKFIFELIFTCDPSSLPFSFPPSLTQSGAKPVSEEISCVQHATAEEFRALMGTGSYTVIDTRNVSANTSHSYKPDTIVLQDNSACIKQTLFYEASYRHRKQFYFGYTVSVHSSNNSQSCFMRKNLNNLW